MNPITKFQQLSFALQFKLLWGALVVAVGMLVGTWFAYEIENSTRQRAADLVSAYIKGIFEPHVEELHSRKNSASNYIAEIDRIFQQPAFTSPIKQMKVWDSSAAVLYSSNTQITGKRFEIDESLRLAFAGQTVAHLASMEKSFHEFDRVLEPELLEVYVPLGLDAAGKPSLVVELYHSTTGLRQDIASAQQRSWWIVLCVSGFAYFVLAMLVNRANHTIESQSDRLREQLNLLQSALQRNQRMQLEMESTGQKVAQLNETFLKRVAADIHDGPAQYIAFSTMQLEVQPEQSASDATSSDTRHKILSALRSSLQELRSIARDLALPGLEDTDLQTVVRRAVSQIQQRQSCNVALHLPEEPFYAGLLIKQTLYRVIQEGLTNAVKHARSEHIDLSLTESQGVALVEIKNPLQTLQEQHSPRGGMGLQLMAERVKLIGGQVIASASVDHVWSLQVELPLSRNAGRSLTQPPAPTAPV